MNPDPFDYSDIEVSGPPEEFSALAIKTHTGKTAELARMNQEGLVTAVDLRVPMRVKKLTSTATLPEYKTSGSAGMDLCADLGGDGNETTIGPGQRKLIQTGLAIAVPPGFEGQIRPRSGLALKQGLTVLNSPGTLDSDYRGPVGIILFNTSEPTQVIRHGDRIAQLVIVPVARAQSFVVEDLDDTERGSGGFGSTGVR